jgi:hypothetical protein
MSRRLLLGGALVAGTFIVIVAVNALRGPRQDGPLTTNSTFNVSFPLAGDEVFVWSGSR